MKKLILLLCLVILSSCSKNEDDDINMFTPPNWIQGVWKNDVSGQILIFSKNDIKYGSRMKMLLQ